MRHIRYVAYSDAGGGVGGPGVREWRRGGAGAFLVGVAPTGLQFAGMTKTQTVRLVGFALIVIGAALFLAAPRRPHSGLGRYHSSRRDRNQPAGYDWSPHAPNRPTRYDWGRHAPSRPARYDRSRPPPSRPARYDW